MKKSCLYIILMLMIVAMLVACGKTSDSSPATEDPTSVAEPTGEATESDVAETTEPIIVEDAGETSYYTENVYAEQIGRYYTALSEQWEEGLYFENGMSALPYYYYEGNPMENVGFGFVDLDNNGELELIIGAIQNADQDPAVFEIWTLVDGQPVMLAQGSTKNRYVLQYMEEDGAWYVANEGTNSAANHFTYYLMLSEGKFEVVQGVVYDAVADEQNPWFMTHDMDGDVSNDEPVDEDTANAIMESYRNSYTALEYVPFASFK